jgi:A/G-specific adenine glycosylase
MRRVERTFAEPLLQWHRDHGRHSLPWRADERTAFEILVAEILLQRTTASAVSGAYLPFVTRYPTPECVVAAPFQELANRIAPLGFQKRARYLDRCSSELLERHGGDVPKNRAALTSLYGVGEYTAGSVLAHAFDQETTAVDTNVRRLVSRFFGIDTGSVAIELVADALVPTGRSSDFLHAMLDFAAAVCKAHSPDCENCRLEANCQHAATQSDQSKTT